LGAGVSHTAQGTEIRDTRLGSTSTSSTNETNEIEEKFGLGREPEGGWVKRDVLDGKEKAKTDRKSWVKPTGGTSSAFPAGAVVSTASCSVSFFSVGASESLTESGECFLEKKL